MNIPGVRLRHNCGQMLVTQMIIHFYLLSRKRARRKDRKRVKSKELQKARKAITTRNLQHPVKSLFLSYFSGESSARTQAVARQVVFQQFSTGIKVEKLAKVPATGFTFYRFCIFVWILCQSSWDRLT